PEINEGRGKRDAGSVKTSQGRSPRPASPFPLPAIGLISVGGTHAAMKEAVGRLRDEGISVDYMRIKAFPFSSRVAEFIESHERCFVVEQNRDAQLRSLIQLETGIARDRMTS